MAKRKATKSSTRDTARAMMEVAGAGAAGFTDTFLSTISFRLRNEADLFMRRVEERTLLMRDRFMLGTYFAILVGAATVFLVVALLLYLVQFGVSWATSFLIGGILILIAAFAFKRMQR